MKAEAAWRAGATGSGVTVAVVDSGVSRDQADLIGRISAASTDVVPGRNAPYVAESSHGTRVSGVIASNFNGQGTIGVAYESTILSIRTDISDCEEKNTDVCFSSSDLVRALDLPVVLVVGLRLGCLNHARLTARAVVADGCRLAGWIGNQVEAPGPHAAAYLDLLRDALPGPCLGVLPFAPGAAPADLAAKLSLA